MSIPVPVHEELVNNERKGTIPFIRFLNDIAQSAGDTTVITNISGDAQISPKSQTILCDATAGDITLTLPSPSSAFSAQRSIKIAISRIDESSNKVYILPNDGELICGETSQFLNRGDVINLVTNKINWYLGA